MIKRVMFGVVAVAVAFACMVPLQRQIDAGKSHAFDEQLLYLPEQRLLKHFTGGMNSLVADVLWIQCIQYTAQQFRGDYKFTWLNQMFDTITDLDPYFCDVYQWGGQFLAMLKADSDASIALLKSGVPHNPTRWELPFEIARTYILNRGDDTTGARYLAMAAATGSPPNFVIEWAKNLQLQHDLDDVQRTMWTDILENSADENMRKLAQRKLIELDLRATCKALNEAIEQFKTNTGHAPAALQDLWTQGLVQGDLQDPLGGTFYIDSAGVAQSSTILQSQRDERRQAIEGWIQRYKADHATWPSALDDLVAKGYAAGLPTNPVEGEEWVYDPQTGTIR